MITAFKPYHRNALSTDIIPAEKNVFYSYSSEFSSFFPVYCLMDCKANKGRKIDDLHMLKQEANALINFYEKYAAIQPVHNELWTPPFGLTNIVQTSVTKQEMVKVSTMKDTQKLTALVKESFSHVNDSKNRISLQDGNMIAIMTNGGNNGQKFALVHIKSIASNVMRVDACHVLV